MKGVLKALSLFDPNAIETRLFRIALNESNSALKELQSWEKNGHPDMLSYLAGSGKWMRGHLPLIYANLSEQLIDTNLKCRPYLKTATLREKMRYEMYEACLKDTLNALNDAGRPFCVVKGAAAANTVYPQPFIRHCHDLDIVVRPEDRNTFEKALVEREFLRITINKSRGVSVRLDHPIGLPVMLHSQPVAEDCRFDAAWIMEGANIISTSGGKMPVASPARRVMHAWLHRFTIDRFERNGWVPDTVLDLRKCTPADIDELNSLLARFEVLPEAYSSALYLCKNFDGLPHLAELRWSQKTRQGSATEMQHQRFIKRAKAQNMRIAFDRKSANLAKLLFAYKRLFPSAKDLNLGPDHTGLQLFHKRLQRLFLYAWRRLKRLLKN